MRRSDVEMERKRKRMRSAPTKDALPGGSSAQFRLKLLSDTAT
jgi:hypothetical protein